MADKISTEYDIILGLEKSDETDRVVSEMTKSLDRVSDGVKSSMGKTADELNAAFGDVEKGIGDVVAQLDHAVGAGHDADKVFASFSASSAKTMQSLEKGAAALQEALSDEGRQAREVLSAKKKQLAMMDTDGKHRKEAKKLAREIAALQKKTIEGSDADLKTALKRNREARAALVFAQKQVKLRATEGRETKKLRDLVKDDLRMIKDKVKAQLDFVRALKTTEGRYRAIKKVAGVALGAAGRGIAGGLKAGAIGAAAGIAGGVASAIEGSAENLAQKDEAARRIRGTYTAAEKDALLSSIRINTGADFPTIIASVVRVQRALGTRLSPSEVVNAATIDLRMPGALDMMAIDTREGSRSLANLNKIFNTFRAGQSRTGLSAEQMTDAVTRATSMRRSSYSRASVSEIANLDALLTSTGAVSEEQRDAIMRDVLRGYAKSSASSLADFLKGYDMTRMLRGDAGTSAIKLTNALKNIDFSAVSATADSRDLVSAPQSAAETAARQTRRFEELKDKLALETMKALEPILTSGEFSKLLDMLFELIRIATPLLGDLLAPMLQLLNPILQAIKPVISAIIDGLSTFFKWVQEKIGDDESEDSAPGQVSATGQARACGGLVMQPSVCGEAGPEAVIPLGYSWQGRAAAVSERFSLSQTFNFGTPHDTTAYSIAGAMLGTSSTARALADSARRGGGINGRTY